MLDDDTKRELLRDTLEPERALSIAVNMELGRHNQQLISYNNTSGLNVVQQFNRFHGPNACTQHQNRSTLDLKANSLCRNCGQKWKTTHCQVCSVMGNKCNHCRILNHFSKVCRKKENTIKNTQQGDRINSIENHENTDKSDNQYVSFINYNEQYDSQYDSSKNNYVVTLPKIITSQC